MQYDATTFFCSYSAFDLSRDTRHSIAMVSRTITWHHRVGIFCGSVVRITVQPTVDGTNYWWYYIYFLYPLTQLLYLRTNKDICASHWISSLAMYSALHGITQRIIQLKKDTSVILTVILSPNYFFLYVEKIFERHQIRWVGWPACVGTLPNKISTKACLWIWEFQVQDTPSLLSRQLTLWLLFKLLHLFLLCAV